MKSGLLEGDLATLQNYMMTTFKHSFSLLFLRGGVSIAVKLCEVGKPFLLRATFKNIKIIDLENINK